LARLDSRGMELGVAIFLTDRSIRPEVVARAAEEAGFESLWLPEHTHLPVDHAEHPGGRDLPDHYRRTLDLFASLGAAAAVTTRIRLATGICLVAQRDPFVTAKAVATVDHLSGGRFLFGIGYGWVRPEIENHGVAFGRRRALVRDRILAMKALWKDEEASYDGETVRFGPSWAWPKPVQDPHPPILLGAAAGPTTTAHLAEFCDGWLPLGRVADAEEIHAMKEAVERAGRDPASFSVSVYGARPEPGALEALAAAGVDRTVLWLPSDEEGPVLEELERFSALLAVTG
jgi:probable F420-dependent oxidoreductase